MPLRDLFNHSRFNRRALRLCASGLCLLLSCAAADGNVPGWNKLVYLIYKIEVTNYCGLTTEAMVDGFHSRRDELLREYNFNEALIANARTEAANLAHDEWSNRGLGGFRGWCREDAARYATELIEAHESTPTIE